MQIRAVAGHGHALLPSKGWALSSVRRAGGEESGFLQKTQLALLTIFPLVNIIHHQVSKYEMSLREGQDHRGGISGGSTTKKEISTDLCKTRSSPGDTRLGTGKLTNRAAIVVHSLLL